MVSVKAPLCPDDDVRTVSVDVVVVANAKSSRDRLGHELLVEDEVVRVEPIRDRLEQLAAVGPEARVKLRQAESEGHVLERGKKAVADVLPAGHAAGQRVPQEAAAQHDA